LPETVTTPLRDLLGSNVVSATNQPNGFSPGVAARLVTDSNERYFIKAVSAQVNAHSVALHQREVEILRVVQELVPERVANLVGVIDAPPWFAVVIRDVEGRHPGEPWTKSDLERVVRGWDDLIAHLTPAPAAITDDVVARLRSGFGGWSDLLANGGEGLSDPWVRKNLVRLAALEERWADATAGNSLLHLDVRSDNILLTETGTVFVDWPHAARGAPGVDLVLFAPTVTMHGGPPPSEVLALSAHGRMDPDQLATLVGTWGGMLTANSLLPPPPGLPNLREFQGFQASILRSWLQEIWGESK
jgi:aminoglycoside phosphotransferase (APT) family kinase protein